MAQLSELFDALKDCYKSVDVRTAFGNSGWLSRQGSKIELSVLATEMARVEQSGLSWEESEARRNHIMTIVRLSNEPIVAMERHYKKILGSLDPPDLPGLTICLRALELPNGANWSEIADLLGQSIPATQPQLDWSDFDLDTGHLSLGFVDLGWPTQQGYRSTGDTIGTLLPKSVDQQLVKVGSRFGSGLVALKAILEAHDLSGQHSSGVFVQLPTFARLEQPQRVSGGMRVAVSFDQNLSDLVVYVDRVRGGSPSAFAGPIQVVPNSNGVTRGGIMRWQTQVETKGLPAGDTLRVRLIHRATGVELHSIGWSPSGQPAKAMTPKLRSSQTGGESEINPLVLFAQMKLHSGIDDCSRALFEGGHYAPAILEAFKRVNIEVKKASGLEGKDGKDLMSQAFRREKEELPVIRLNQLKSVSEKDEQDGFMFIYMGSMLGIRNPKAHDIVKLDDPVKALEYLALASLLMRRLDERVKSRKPKR